MKKALSLLLALSLLFSCAGCAPAASSSPEIPPATAAYRQLSTPRYPEMAAYPDQNSLFFEKAYEDWAQDRRERRTLFDTDVSSLENFYAQTVPAFLSGSDEENRVYSPLNLYMALAMLCEVTDGESRTQILDLLGSESLDALRTQASTLWNANYCDDGTVTSIPASSLWLNETVTFRQKTLDSLAEYYYASSHQGTMGSAEMDRALQNWINEQTGNLLTEQAADLHLDPNTVMALATTLYFRAKWHNEFTPNLTLEDTFHLSDGTSVPCDFMHQSATKSYYWCENFSAVSQSLQNSGAMWLILPDEGVSTEEVLAGEQFTQFLLSGESWENRKRLIVNLSLPKFDVSGKLELGEPLQALGIRDVFDAETADFSSMTENVEGIFLSQAEQAARVCVDEEGCTAAAYTVLAMAGAAAPPDEEIDFVLDRPFLFAITGTDALPLFVGIVNRP